MGVKIRFGHDGKTDIQGRVRFCHTGNRKCTLGHLLVRRLDPELQRYLLPCLRLHPQKLHGHVIHQNLIGRLRRPSVYDIDKTVLIMILRIIPGLHVPLQKFFILHAVGHQYTVCRLHDGRILTQFLILLSRDIFDHSVIVAAGLPHGFPLKVLHRADSQCKQRGKQHSREGNSYDRDNISRPGLPEASVRQPPDNFLVFYFTHPAHHL